MPQRLVQITLPKDATIDDLGEHEDFVASWLDEHEEHRIVQLAVEASEVEALTDRLSGRWGEAEGFRVAVTKLGALLPRSRPIEEDDGEEGKRDRNRADRISRDELLAAVTEGLDPDRVFVALAALSAVVASVGLLRDDTAVLIGAMVIAPLLLPNVALGLASTLGDLDLARRALGTILVGVGVVFSLAWMVGAVVPVDATLPAIESRTALGLDGLVLALASGAAGALSFTRGLAGPLIGVMVAVALVPPLVAAGLLFGSGQGELAWGAALLAAGNVVSVNLAAVGTFLAVGVRPRTWWEKTRARRAVWVAGGLWLLALAVLVAVLTLAESEQDDDPVDQAGASAAVASISTNAAASTRPATATSAIAG